MIHFACSTCKSVLQSPDQAAGSKIVARSAASGS